MKSRHRGVEVGQCIAALSESPARRTSGWRKRAIRRIVNEGNRLAHASIRDDVTETNGDVAGNC